MDKDMGDPGGVTTVLSSELRSELQVFTVHVRDESTYTLEVLAKSAAEARRFVLSPWDAPPDALGDESDPALIRRTARILRNGAPRQAPADPQPRDEQQPLQETDHDR